MNNIFLSTWMFFFKYYVHLTTFSKHFFKHLIHNFQVGCYRFFSSVCSKLFFFKTIILGADWLGDCIHCFENQSPPLFFKTLFLHCFVYKSLTTIHYIWCSFGAYLTKKSKAHIVLTQMDTLHWASKYFPLCSFGAKWKFFEHV